MRKLVELTDNLRLKAALEIVKVIQKGDLKEAYGNMGKIVTLMKDEDIVDKLNDISPTDLVPEPDFKSPQAEYATILLMIMKTRDE